MARCDKCKFWNDSVFNGSSASGYGCWQGWCGNKKYQENKTTTWYEESKHHNLWMACEYFEKSTEDRWAKFREKEVVE